MDTRSGWAKRRLLMLALAWSNFLWTYLFGYWGLIISGLICWLFLMSFIVTIPRRRAGCGTRKVARIPCPLDIDRKVAWWDLRPLRRHDVIWVCTDDAQSWATSFIAIKAVTRDGSQPNT